MWAISEDKNLQVIPQQQVWISPFCATSAAQFSTPTSISTCPWGRWLQSSSSDDPGLPFLVRIPIMMSYYGQMEIVWVVRLCWWMFCPRLQASYSPTVSDAVCSKLQMFVTFKHKSNLNVIQWMQCMLECYFRLESTDYFNPLTRLPQNGRTKKMEINNDHGKQ